MNRTAYASYFSAILRAPDLGAGPGGGGGGAGPGGGGSDAPPPPPNGGGAAADWSAGLTDYHPTIEAKGWKGQPIDKVLPDLFKSYTTLEKAVGNNIPIPGKDAKPEEWDAVYGKLGRPAEAIGDKGYKLPEAQYSEHDLAFHKTMLPVLHGARVTQQQLDAIIPKWNEAQAAQRTALDDNATKYHETSKGELVKAFGGEEKYKTELDLANRAFHQVFGQAAGELMDARLADGRYLRHVPGLIQGMAKLGNQFKESGALDGNSPENFHDAGDKSAVKTELDKIYADAAADQKHPYVNQAHPEHQAMQEKVFKLTQQLAGAG